MAKKPAFLKEGSAAEEKLDAAQDKGKAKGKAKGFKPFVKKGKK